MSIAMTKFIWSWLEGPKVAYSVLIMLALSIQLSRGTDQTAHSLLFLPSLSPIWIPIVITVRGVGENTGRSVWHSACAPRECTTRVHDWHLTVSLLCFLALCLWLLTTGVRQVPMSLLVQSEKIFRDFKVSKINWEFEFRMLHSCLELAINLL